jgi:hypothetical protein
LIETSVPKERSARKRMHAVLKEATERYRHELMDEEERCELRDRIIRLKKKLARL